MCKDIIVCDLDGTIAFDEHRVEKYLRQGAKDWDGYYSSVSWDLPNEAVIRVLQTMDEYYRIFIFSGRIERTRKETVEWLEKYHVPYDILALRPDDCREQDTTLKISWACEMQIMDKIVFVMEDRQRMVDAWRRAGVSCFQVAVGNF